MQTAKSAKMPAGKMVHTPFGGAMMRSGIEMDEPSKRMQQQGKSAMSYGKSLLTKKPTRLPRNPVEDHIEAYKTGRSKYSGKKAHRQEYDKNLENIFVRAEKHQQYKKKEWNKFTSNNPQAGTKEASAKRHEIWREQWK